MIRTTIRTRRPAERCAGTMRTPWPFGLHRRVAAAAVGAACVFALQIRDRRNPGGPRAIRNLPFAETGLRDAERREESP